MTTGAAQAWLKQMAQFLAASVLAPPLSASELVCLVDELLSALERHVKRLSYVAQREAVVAQVAGGLPGQLWPRTERLGG